MTLSLQVLGARVKMINTKITLKTNKLIRNNFTIRAFRVKRLSDEYNFLKLTLSQHDGLQTKGAGLVKSSLFSSSRADNE